MKRITKILSSISLGLFLSFSSLLVGVAHAAATGTMSLSPSSGSINIGDTINIDIHEDSGATPIYSVRAALTYPSASLTFVSFTPNTAAFSIVPTNKGGSGTAEFEAATATPVTGDQVIATVTFTAAQGTGSAAVGLNAPNPSNLSDPSASSAQTYTSGAATEALGSVSGGSFSLTGGAVTPPASGSSGSSSSGSSSSSSKSSTSTKSSGSSSSTSKSTGTTSTPAAGPTISGVSVTGVTADGATVSWQTSVPTTSEVDYGVGSGAKVDYGFVSANPSLVTSHSLKLAAVPLESGTLYHFAVKGTDASGNSATSPDSTFRTNGLTLVVAVVDQHNKAVKGAVVSISSVSGTTDSSGKATLKDLPVGKQNASITFDGVTTNTTVTTKAASTGGDTQNATLKINVSNNSHLALILPIIGIGAILILLFYGRTMMMNRRDSSQELSRHFPKLPGSGTAAGTNTGLPSIITPGSSTPSTPTVKPIQPGNTLTPDSVKPDNLIKK